MLYIYNSLTEKKEIFTPIDANLIKLYVCGPTVYDYIHIGNGRAAVVYDLLYRILIGIYGEQHVKYVRNITDVDDKINARAIANNISISELTKLMTAHFVTDTQYLACLRPTIEPKATEHIEDMINIINLLIESQYAYATEKGNVYFSIKKYTDYGKLANKNIESFIENVRLEALEDKQDNCDFALWKAQSPNDPVSALFDSPWGMGRPGWHIECSAMSYKHLGENFDIHGGGVDLIFPHHANEMAQSICAFKDSKFANYWVHNGTLTVLKNKMSKSLGNFITVKHFQEKNIPGEAIRYFLLSANYHKPLDYSPKALEDCYGSLYYLYNTLRLCYKKDITANLLEYKNLPEDFKLALLDNLNTAKAFSLLLNFAKQINKNLNAADLKEKVSILKSCGNFLGILNYDLNVFFDEKKNPEIDSLIAARAKAKAEKDWVKADALRADMLAKDIILEDLPDGSTFWRRKLNID